MEFNNFIGVYLWICLIVVASVNENSFEILVGFVYVLTRAGNVAV